ncbi:MAG TPA: phosphoribosylanthranilate isomerase [Pyrinomonadaceae bacterium]|nr:phosphoribosylanthranilate isomerase [Pyrinomonadaceae bacterium]
MTFIKICGITNLADALVAVDAGADALGFNFYRPSPRYIEPNAAREIIDQLPREVMKVGVFVNEPTPESVMEIVRRTGIGAVQLHGDESPDYCRALAASYVIKVLAAGDDFELNSVLAYEVDAIMLDARHEQLRGGTGQVIDWSLAKKVTELSTRLFLAGGLSPENVAEAISAVKPYAVDACSALEVVPGKKNHAQVREFIYAVRHV